MPLACGRLTSQLILSGWSECNTISFVMRYVDCHGECGRCRLMMQGLEILSDWRIVGNALFAWGILAGRVDCVDLVLMLQFE
jgi:hypothetical protein